MKSKHIFIFSLFWLITSCQVPAAENSSPPAVKPGWKLTFRDEFERPILDDMYWYSAYRSGRKEYFKRIGHKSRWVDHNVHYVIEDGILKLRIDEKLPFRPQKSTPCVSCITTSDHRFGQTTAEYQIMDKFAQKYGWFEIRCRMPRGSGLMSAFWLHQHDPTKQEYTPEGRRKGVGDGVLEIDIFEQQGRYIQDKKSKVDLNIHFTKGGHSRPTVDADLSKDFHVWAMEWREGRVDWYFDGKVIKTYKGPTPQEKMFVLVALFHYNGWIGKIDPNMQYPRDFEIDYVRVYARDKDATAARKTAKNSWKFPRNNSSKKVAPKAFSRTLKGPFSSGKNYTPEPIGDSWIKISDVSFVRRNEDQSLLSITYGPPKEKYHNKIRKRITATTREGKKHVLCDGISNAHMGPMKKWLGSSMADVIPVDSISIPTNPEEIVELKMEYIPER